MEKSTRKIRGASAATTGGLAAVDGITAGGVGAIAGTADVPAVVPVIGWAVGGPANTEHSRQGETS